MGSMRTCEVCDRMIPINKDGTLRTHGPRKERCAGGRPSAPKSPEDKADRYIAEGRVKPEVVHIIGGELQGAVVWVQGSDAEPYKVESNGAAWWCDCPAHSMDCAHVIAAKTVIDAHQRIEFPNSDPELDALIPPRGEAETFDLTEQDWEKLLN